MNHQDRILAIIRRVANRDVSPSPDESLFDSGIIDSFSLEDMVSELEREFSIRIPDSEARPQKFESIERIEQYIASRV